ncbi:MAG TPA: zinc ribbon domain-containing protein [Coriobacteriia bacterium]
MQCAQCGTENDASATFCAVCGSRFGDVEPSADVAPVSQPLVTEPVAASVYAPVATAPSPVATTTTAPPPPPRKKHGCLITTIVLFSVVAVAAAAVVWFVTRPPRDLGVSYTEADYQSAVAKLGIEIVDEAPNLPVEQTKVVYSGKKQVSVHLTSKEVSAVISMHHRSPKWALSDVQILLGTDNQVQMSGFAVYQATRYGFYADLNVLLASPQSVGGSADKIVVFGIDFPQQWYGPAVDYIVQATNDWLSGMGQGLDIQSASIENGELVLQGTVPASIRRVALSSINTTGTLTP